MTTKNRIYPKLAPYDGDRAAARRDPGNMTTATRVEGCPSGRMGVPNKDALAVSLKGSQQR
jgi:hypothetical protein